jgi:hypothetical protein
MANIRESFDDRIKRMRQLSNIQEANYSLVGGLEEDDEMPDLTEPQAEKPKPEVPEEDPNAAPDQGADDMGAADADGMNNVSNDGEMDIDIPAEPTPEMGGGMEEPALAPEEPSVEEKQNEIIKMNISAMEKMQNVINSLESTVNSLNSKIGELSADVEEVREPKNVEKLMNRKEDSHPFYYNLNDMWQGNSFQARREVEEMEQGIKKLEDGSYIADFDDLPKHNSQEIGKSFNLNLRENRKHIN